VQFNPALVPAWMAVVVIGREFLVSGLRSIAASEGFTIQASELGKFKMLVQIISVVAVILAHRWHEWPVGGIYIFPVYWIACWRSGSCAAVAGFRARLLYRLLVADRSQVGKAAAPDFRPRPAEKERCPSGLIRLRNDCPQIWLRATCRATGIFARTTPDSVAHCARSDSLGRRAPGTRRRAADFPLLSERRGVFTTLYLKVEHLSKVRRELRDALAIPNPSLRCIARLPKRPAPPPSTIRGSRR